jgi:hypothetical protein
LDQIGRLYQIHKIDTIPIPYKLVQSRLSNLNMKQGSNGERTGKVCLEQETMPLACEGLQVATSVHEFSTDNCRY